MMGVINEGLHDTSWENDEGNKITLMDLLDSTEDIPVSNISVEELINRLVNNGEPLISKYYKEVYPDGF